MPARILDGTAVANQIREELRPRIAEFTARAGRPPGLGIVLAGDNPASEIYVATKLKSAGDVGCRTELIRVPATASLDEALAAVRRLNEDDASTASWCSRRCRTGWGPTPNRWCSTRSIRPRTSTGSRPSTSACSCRIAPASSPCTPRGVMELLRRCGIALKGARAVVLGRSDIVGKPMAMLLLHEHATVTICHSRTQRPAVGRARGRPAGGRDRPHRPSCSRTG